MRQDEELARAIHAVDSEASQADKRRQEIMEAWQWVMKTRQGRKVIRDILSMTGSAASPFVGNTNATIKNVGMQDVGRLVQNAARDFAFDDYMKLINEEHNDD